MHERRFNPANLAKLDNPERRKALPPERILAYLDIESGDTVLDLGAGTGYFALPAAEMAAVVYALDAEPQMLAALEEKARERQLDNIKLIRGEIEQIPLDDDSVDRAIASLVMHEVDPLSRGIAEIRRVRKPGGSCLCLEWEKKESEQGPPLHHRIHSDEKRQAFRDGGFSTGEAVFPTDAHYLLIVMK